MLPTLYESRKARSREINWSTWSPHPQLKFNSAVLQEVHRRFTGGVHGIGVHGMGGQGEGVVGGGTQEVLRRGWGVGINSCDAEEVWGLHKVTKKLP